MPWLCSILSEDNLFMGVVWSSARFGWAAAVGLVVLAVAEGWIGTALWQQRLPAGIWSGLLGGVVFGLAGVAEPRLRRDSRRVGLWMVVFAALQLLRQVMVPHQLAVAGFVDMLRMAVMFLQPAVGGYLLFSFPTGSFTDDSRPMDARRPGEGQHLRAERQRLVHTGFWVAAVGAAVVAPSRQPVPWICGSQCTPNPFGLTVDLRLYIAVQVVIRLMIVSLVVVGLVLLVRLAWQWTSDEWRFRWSLFATSCLAIVGYAVFEALTVSAYLQRTPIIVVQSLEHTALWAIVLALPVAFLVGILNEYSSQEKLEQRLEGVTTVDDIQQILREEFHDEALHLVSPPPAETGDAAGDGPAMPPGRAEYTLGDVGVIKYSQAIREHQPQYFKAAMSRVQGDLESIRREGEMQARPAKVYASGAAESPVPSRIFVSYRRADSEEATAQIVEGLKLSGKKKVFMDVASIDYGDDFMKRITDAIVASDVVLVVIGKDWLKAADHRGRRRLKNPKDIVRLEIKHALQWKKPLLPLLVNGAVMPRRDELPSDLEPLSRLNAMRLRLDHKSWHAEVIALIQAIDRRRS